jgi:hypothetical protein
MLCHDMRCIFLIAPLSYAAVALALGQCEKRLRDEKLATSSLVKLLYVTMPQGEFWVMTSG